MAIMTATDSKLKQTLKTMEQLISRINNLYLGNYTKSLEPTSEPRVPEQGLQFKNYLAEDCFMYEDRQVNIHSGRVNIYSYSEFTMINNHSLSKFSLLFFLNRNIVSLTPVPQWSNLVLSTINHHGHCNTHIVTPKRGTSYCRQPSA